MPPLPYAALSRELIGSADVIVYPIGSFWSSVCANLIPAGVGQASGRERRQVPAGAPVPMTAPLDFVIEQMRDSLTNLLANLLANLLTMDSG